MLATSSALLLFAPVLASARTGDGPCDLPSRDGERVTHRVTRLITCAAERWPVRGGADRAICVADHESGLNPKATSPDGLFVGLYQHSAAAWPDRYDAWTRRAWQLGDNPLFGRSNAIVTIRMVSETGWGPWRGVEGC